MAASAIYGEVAQIQLLNLPLHWTENDVKSLVDQCGFSVVSLSLPRDEDGKSQKMAFCEMISHQKCIDFMESFALKKKGDCAPEEKSICVQFADLKEFYQNKVHEMKNLYLGNIDEDITEDDLRDSLSKHGKVHYTKILKDMKGQSRGFGFCQLGSNEECLSVIDVLDGKSFPERSAKLKVRFAAYRRRRSVRTKDYMKENTNLFIGKLPSNATSDDLDEIFSSVGKVISAKIMRRDDGSSKGYGFCEMKSRAECDKAIAAFNGTDALCSQLDWLIRGYSQPLVVEYSKKKKVPTATLR